VSGAPSPTESDRRRAGRLLRWYPRAWRVRYGDEFSELLASDIAERPRSWRRTGDVVQRAAAARLTGTGLTGHPLDPADQVRASLATLVCALAVFLAFGLAMWSQLTIGWQWSDPDTAATRAAVVVLSGVVLCFAVLTLLAAGPVVWALVRRATGRRFSGLAVPSALFAGGLAVLAAGGRHFANGWPGTGGHPWLHQGLVPGGVAAFTWAATLSVTSYWAHPGALASFPAAEVVWMAVSPLAMGAMVIGAATTVRRLDLSPGALRYETRLAQAGALAMAVFVLAVCGWIADGGPGPKNLFHAGAIDVAGVVVMAAGLAVAARALHTARRGGPAGLAR